MALLPFPALVPDFPLLAGKLVEELDVVAAVVVAAVVVVVAS